MACANRNEPDTNGSQFFLTLDRADHCDRKYTIFGKVTGGWAGARLWMAGWFGGAAWVAWGAFVDEQRVNQGKSGGGHHRWAARPRVGGRTADVGSAQCEAQLASRLCSSNLNRRFLPTKGWAPQHTTTIHPPTHTYPPTHAGDTIYNVLRFNEQETDDDDRPMDPPRLLRADVLWNPFDDIVPRVDRCRRAGDCVTSLD